MTCCAGVPAADHVDPHRLAGRQIHVPAPSGDEAAGKELAHAAADGASAAAVADSAGFARGGARRASGRRRNFVYNFSRMVRFLTAGESHGRALVVILEGIPAGLALDLDAITRDLRRRQGGYGRGRRMAIESDRRADPVGRPRAARPSAARSR